MMKWVAAIPLAFMLALPATASDAEHHHDHPAPEKLGAVTFATSCNPAVKPAFDKALALLHSFAYTLSEQAFRDVSARDPGCAMAHWGMAMTHYHDLWEPPSGDDLRQGAQQIGMAARVPAGSRLERQFIDALELYY